MFLTVNILSKGIENAVLIWYNIIGSMMNGEREK
jgi:hypothetical protein